MPPRSQLKTVKAVRIEPGSAVPVVARDHEVRLVEEAELLDLGHQRGVGVVDTEQALAWRVSTNTISATNAIRTTNQYHQCNQNNQPMPPIQPICIINAIHAINAANTTDAGARTSAAGEGVDEDGVGVGERRLLGHQLVEAGVGPVVARDPGRADPNARLVVPVRRLGRVVRGVRRKVQEEGPAARRGAGDLWAVEPLDRLVREERGGVVGGQPAGVERRRLVVLPEVVTGMSGVVKRLSGVVRGVSGVVRGVSVERRRLGILPEASPAK